MKYPFICVKKSKIIAIFVCFAIIFLHFILYFNVLEYKNVVDTLSHKVFNSFSHKKNASESNNSDDDIYFVLIKQKNEKNCVNCLLEIEKYGKKLDFFCTKNGEIWQK